jgi:hypothetical protein
VYFWKIIDVSCAKIQEQENRSFIFFCLVGLAEISFFRFHSYKWCCSGLSSTVYLAKDPTVDMDSKRKEVHLGIY